VVFSGVQASILSLCADNTIPQSPIIYCSSYYSGNTTVFVVDGSLNPIFKPVTAPVNGTVVNLASAAQNNLLTVFAEIANNYSFDSTIATNFIQGIEIVITPVPFYSVFSSGSSSITVSNSSELVNGMFLVDNTTPGNIPAGTFIAVSGTTVALYTNPASPTPTATAGNSATSPGDQLVACSIIASTDGYIIRGVGLASKAFIVDGSIYFLASQQSAYQSTYFLVNGSKSITNALTEYSFTVNPLNQSVDFGTVYSNGINTYVVVAQTLAGATTLFCSGSGSPVPGYTTLALVGGTGQAVISASSSTVITTVSPPVVSAKLAYENGAGPYVAGSAYCPLGLPSVTVNGDLAQVSYLYKDLIESLNTLANPQQTTTGGIYSQTGIQLANFTIATQGLDSAEIGNSLILSGGFGWMYDGYLPVEQNFFLWPENVEASLVADPTPTGTALNASKALTVSSGTNITVGMNVYDTTNSSYIPSGTVVTAVSGTAVTLSKATTHAISGDTITFTGNVTAQQYYYQAVYEWADNQGNVHRSAPSIPVTVTATAGHTSIKLNIPTLRLTYKTANPVKIVVYRWSAANQTYYQTFLAQGYPNSITSPILNFTSVDSVVFEDVASDSAIIGNSIIYTTGGVVEDVNPPASNLITLFDTRVWMVDAEDPNLLWFSKQVIENTPVEMSDLFTFYVAPTTAAQGSTGPITALSVMDDKLIIFKKNAIYYINGIGPDNTGNSNGYSQPIFITSTVGCSNQQSIVFINDGLMFQSDKGIWLLGRNTSTQYIGSPVEEFNDGVVQSAVNVPETNQVRFTLSTGQTLMYDYFYGQWGTFVNVPAVSSTIFQGVHTYLDSYGKIYQETPGQYLDGSKPVLISFKTSWFNLANLQGYERFYDFYILARYLTPHFLLCSVAYDYNDSILHRKLISPTNFSSATPSGFGVPTPFGSPANREQWRIHAKQQLCQSFQLTISEVFNPAYGTVPGAGFTMSGITAEVEIKRGTRPVKGGNSAGMS
jgi:hypothetical protein